MMICVIENLLLLRFTENTQPKVVNLKRISENGNAEESEGQLSRANVMSSDVDDEQVLPESLQKLEIVPDCSHASLKCKLTNEHNPFYSVPTAAAARVAIDRDIDNVFGPSCSDCGNHEINESKVSRPSAYSAIEHGVMKHVHFKQRERDRSAALNEKKLLFLREPILKSIGRSIHHSHSRTPTSAPQNCQMKFSNSSSSTEPICSDGQLPNLENSNSNSISSASVHRSKAASATRQAWNEESGCSIDFKSLVSVCNDLSPLELSSDGRAFNRHRTKGAPPPDSPNGIGNVNSELAALAIAGSSSSGGSMNTSVSSNSSASSSCSQQARMNSSNCDVTIDELASYFETFVHIPKKMSSMAEMMYI